MYIVEGNIGAGKSTFLQLLAQHIPTLSIALEPDQAWQHTAQGKSLLENFYQDPARWAYAMETFMLNRRVQEYLQYQKNTQTLLIERSIYSGHYCFATNSFESGFLSLLEWNLYTDLFNFLVPSTCKPPSGFIYLRLDPRIAYERIQKRKRDGESSISREYLQAIHDRHESFLINNKATIDSLKKVPVLILDCNEDFEHNQTVLDQHIHAVQNFLQQSAVTFKPAVVDVSLLRQLQNPVKYNVNDTSST